MVGSYHDQCLMAVLQIEIVRHLYCIIEINHLFETCSSIIAMTSLVNASTLNHHEKALLRLFHHKVQCRRSDVHQVQVTFLSVDAERQMLLVGIDILLQ